MKTRAVIGLLLASCASTSIADVVMPDELTLGHADTTSALVGGYAGHQPMYGYDGDSSTTAVALTWKLPQFSNEQVGRSSEWEATREANMVPYETEEEEEIFSESMATGATFKADWRHATAFGSVLVLLLIVLLVKLQRSNGWH